MAAAMQFTGVLSAAALVVSGTLAARPAAACSPAPCWPASAIPEPGATVPANAPALGFSPGDAPRSASGAPSFELLDADGKAVEVALEETAPGSGSYLVKPKAPLQPATTYRMRYLQGCPSYQPLPEPETTEQTFKTGPPAAKPTSIGKAVVTGHRLVTSFSDIGVRSCYVDLSLPMGLTHVEVQPSPEFKAYLALGSVRASIKGETAPMIDYRQPGDNAPIEFDIYTNCAGETANGLVPGKYELQVEASILGVAPLPPPISTTIEANCRPTSGAAPTGNGCSYGVSRSTSPAGANWLGMVAVLAIAVRHRDRRRGSRASDVNATGAGPHPSCRARDRR